MSSRLKQLEFFGEPAVIADEPMSICAIVENTNGQVSSGQQRLAVTDDVQEALHWFCLHAIALYGWEGAAKLVLKLMARDPSMRLSIRMNDFGRFEGNWLPWLLLDEHRAALREQFARDRSHGRADDYSTGGEDE